MTLKWDLSAICCALNLEISPRFFPCPNPKKMFELRQRAAY